MFSATAVTPVQFLCNFGAALQEKIFVNVHELPIGQFLHLFGLFCFVRPDKFLCIKCYKKGKKPCHFDILPPPSTICAGVLGVKLEAKQ